MTEKYHTIIIGAGPAGLSCAAILAEAGRRVLLLERRAKIGPKVCAGGITASGLGNLLPEELIERSFLTQEIFTNRQHCTIAAREPIIKTVNRKNLGQFMLREALNKGVTIRTSSPVLRLRENSLETGTARYRFRYLVGADGSNSLVRRSLKIPGGTAGTGLNYTVPGSFPKMEWHFDSTLFGNGYAWIFPHRESASLGVYCSNQQLPPRQLLKNLHIWAAKRGINLSEYRLQAGKINYDFQGWQFGRRFLTGDAAGLASPLTGEGIFPAVISGRETARRILNRHYACPHLTTLIARQRRHRRLVELTAGGKPVSKIIMEGLVFALRIGLINYKALEMADGLAGNSSGGNNP